MSKYQQRGAYHYDEFKTEGSEYQQHVLDVVQHVQDNVVTEGTILDVGAGEGLISRVLANRGGFKMVGCDTDEHACGLAAMKGNNVHRGTIDIFAGNRYDAVLMLDVLEHVEDLEHTVRVAQTLTDLIFVAVPSIHDPGAHRQMICEQVLSLFDGDWVVAHVEARNARDFVIFKAKVEQAKDSDPDLDETVDAPEDEPSFVDGRTV